MVEFDRVSTCSAQQLDLFETSRWPRKPYCSDDLEQGLCIRSLASAIKRPYIQANPPHLRVWSIFDVDRPGAAVLWEDQGLPPPSWAAVNRENGHAHLVWGLSVPVLVDSPDLRQAPMRYLCAVESAFRARLQADQGYSGLITKNPVHPLWKTLRGPQLGYELGDLADWVDLPKHIPKRKPEEVGLGRNVTVFDWLRLYAYRKIRHYKLDVRNFIQWQSHLNGKALERNGDFLYPLDGREVWHIAKSVSKWVWHKFDLAASDARFSALQAHRGRKGGVKGGPGSRTEARDRCLILLSFRHGLRVSEACGLRLHQVDLDSRVLHVARLKQGLSTTHPLRADELRVIKAWLAERNRLAPVGDAFFVSERRQPLNRRTAWVAIRRYGELAELAVEAHPHMLRHACGYALADQGADTRLIQDYLGHRNIQHTVRYTATNPARFERLWR